ncbi:MAG: PEP/pyruvate-binding domain-containing protein [Myxococcota bacterium]
MTFLLLLAAFAGSAPFPGQEHTFVSYGRIPTWTGVASQLDGDVRIDLYDSGRYPGHADFVSKGLSTGMTFRQFKAAVRDGDRAYLPFFLYDLRGQEPTVDGRARSWAVRVEDYGYADDAASLGRDVLQLAEALAVHTGFPREQGLIVLASSDAVRPNRASAPVIEAAGWAHATVTGLQKGEPQRFEVLNPGTAVGVLRVVRGVAPLALSPRDVVVYDALPARVPPVAAIFTLAPQTPLSHVNLLARNRGTPNVHLRSLDVLGVSEGDIVRVEAGAQLRVTRASQAELEAYWKGRKATPVEIPVADRSAGLVALRTRPGVEQVGAKAANYALLQELLPDHVRPGHALGFAAYFAHVERSGAGKRIEALLAGLSSMDAAAVDAALEGIRDAIREAPVDPAVLDALLELRARDYPGVRLRLRSSTNNEDLPRFNGAGLYTSKGLDADEGREKLESQLTKVFASLWSEHAFAERAFYGVDHRSVGMAVLIHEAFPDEAANGVVLTIPAADGVQVVVNANPGEASVTNPEAGVVPERLVFPLGSPGSPRIEGRSSIGPVFAGGFAESLLPVLADDVARIHAALTATRAEHDYGVDVEFKVVHTPSGLALFVKQARLLAATGPE